MQNDSGAAKMITSITHAIFSFEGLLVLATPLLAFAYRVIKQFGMWDRLVGRDRALEGLKRLRSTAGYPASWLYDNEANANTYEAVYTRLKKNCKETKIKKLLDDGLRPALIATAGSPIEIKGVPPEWPQDRADSKSHHGFVSGCRRAIASSAVMSCITACMPALID
jgi:hypothetical protein